MTDLKIHLSVGDKVKFAEEKQRYSVRAVSSDGRWAVCTKPFNPLHTVLYTVVDLEDQVRGRDDCHGLGYETDELCAAACAMFESGEAEHSLRRHPPIRLRIDTEKSFLRHPAASVGGQPGKDN